MDAGRLIKLIIEAEARARDVLPYFLGEPYTATSVSAMNCEVHKSIEGINRVLREELGIELYVEIVPTLSDTTVQGYLKARKCESLYIEG